MYAGNAMSREHDAGLINALTHSRFEVVPIRGMDEQALYLPGGATVTVTCSPSRGIDNTLRVTAQLAEMGLHVVPHISARLVTGMPHLEAILRRLSDLRVREIFVMGGDVGKPVGTFSGALDLLLALEATGHDLTEIGVAAYPEGHPLLEDATLSQVLRDKQHLATYMVTQITFDPRAIISWLHRMRQEGIELPAYIGMPGVVDVGKLLRVSMRIGVGESIRFLSKRTGLIGGLLGRSSYGPTSLVEALAPYFGDPEYNIRALHLNTFNQVQSTEEWRQRMLRRTTTPDVPRSSGAG